MKSKTGFEKEIISSSFEETQKIGEELSKNLLASKGETLRGRTRIIALYGELGSGKTTFVKGLANGLGIKRRILSPTFTLIKEHEIKYEVRNEKSEIKVRSLKFYHIDLYRVQNINDIKGLGLEELFNESGNIIVIEWAEKMGELLPKERIDIWFEYLDENKRKIKVVC